MPFAPVSSPTLINPIQAAAGSRTLGFGHQEAAAGDDPRFGHVFAGVGDTAAMQCGSISASSNVLSCSQASFQTADAGKTVVVLGAGAAGAPLLAAIASRVSGTSVTLSVPASTTVANARFWYGTDDTAALTSAVSSAAPSGTVQVPPSARGGQYLILGTHSVPATVRLTIAAGATFAIPMAGWSFLGDVQAGPYQILDLGSPLLANSVIGSHAAPQVEWFGARGDWRQVTDAVLHASQPTVQSASAAFTAADLGKWVGCWQVHSATPDFGIVQTGSNLTTIAGTGPALGVAGRIISVDSATQVTLDANSNVTITGAWLDIGTRNELPFRRAMTVCPPSGARVGVGPGIFGLVQDGFYGSTAIVELPASTAVVGRSHSQTRLVLFSQQPSFSRMLMVFGGTAGSRMDVSLRDLCLDGNKIPQLNPNEQQHAILVREGSGRFSAVGCRFTNTRGDSVYFGCFSSDQTLVPDGLLLDACFFDASQRDSVHAQSFRNLGISNCRFSGGNGQFYIKQEPDGAGEFGIGASITGCTFDCSTVAGSGILFAGSASDAPNRTRDIVVSGNTFRNCGIGVQIGVFSDNWTISSNVFDGCTGVTVGTVTFNTSYGLAGYDRIVFSNNVIVNQTTAADQPTALFANVSQLVVANNTVQGGSGLNGGFACALCQDVQISGNDLSLAPTAASQTAIHLSEVRTARVSGNIVRNTSTTEMLAMVYVDDLFVVAGLDLPAQDIYVAPDNVIVGKFAHGVAGLVTAPDSLRNALNSPNADAAVVSGALNSFTYGGSATPGAFGFARASGYVKPYQNLDSAWAWVAQIPSADSPQRAWPTKAIAINGAYSSTSDPFGWFTVDAGSHWTALPAGGGGGSPGAPGADGTNGTNGINGIGDGMTMSRLTSYNSGLLTGIWLGPGTDWASATPLEFPLGMDQVTTSSAWECRMNIIQNSLTGTLNMQVSINGGTLIGTAATVSAGSTGAFFMVFTLPGPTFPFPRAGVRLVGNTIGNGVVAYSYSFHRAS